MKFSEISARDAFELLKRDDNSIIIDVRTEEEFNSVGIIDSSQFNNRMILLPWRTNPNMVANPNFSASLQQSLKQIFNDQDKNANLIFICRSGVRSSEAAMHAISLGYKNSFNLINGFEAASKDHNPSLNGWKASNLPWRTR